MNLGIHLPKMFLLINLRSKFVWILVNYLRASFIWFLVKCLVKGTETFHKLLSLFLKGSSFIILVNALWLFSQFWVVQWSGVPSGVRKTECLASRPHHVQLVPYLSSKRNTPLPVFSSLPPALSHPQGTLPLSFLLKWPLTLTALFISSLKSMAPLAI